jgi:hypothetical protein
MRPSQGGQGKQKQGHQSANKDVVHSSKELKWKKGSRGSGIEPTSASTQRHAQEWPKHCPASQSGERAVTSIDWSSS